MYVVESSWELILVLFAPAGLIWLIVKVLPPVRALQRIDRGTVKSVALVLFTLYVCCISTVCRLRPMYGDQKLFVDGEYSLAAQDFLYGAFIWPWQRDRYVILSTSGSCKHTIFEVHQQIEEELLFDLELKEGALYTEVGQALHDPCQDLLWGGVVPYKGWLPEIESFLLWYPDIRVGQVRFSVVTIPKREKPTDTW